MVEQNGNIAILIDVMRDEQGKVREPGVRLYQSLTCNGSLGPSEIIFLAPDGVKYSDDEPTIDNVKNIFQSFSNEAHQDSRCLIWIRARFDQGGVDLLDGKLSIDECSDLINRLSCSSVNVVLDGPGSEKAVKAFQKEGRRIMYTERTDGKNKTTDLLDVPSVFQGDHIAIDLVLAEKQRLLREGYLLHWND